MNNFEEKYKKYIGLVYKICFTYTSSRDDAEDLVQDIFLKYYNCQRTFESDYHEKNWIARTTINHCRDFLKSKWKKNVVINNEMIERHKSTDCFENEENELVFKILSEMKEEFKTVLILYYYDNNKTKDIALILKKSELTIKKRLAKAREIMREGLIKYGKTNN